MKKLMLVLIASACCSAFTMNASAQQADQAIADAVIAHDKGAMGGWNKRSDECRGAVEGHVGRLHRVQRPICHASRRESDEFAAGGGGLEKSRARTTAAEMSIQKVQVYNGNVAILTYNYVGPYTSTRTERRNRAGPNPPASL